MRVGQAVVVAVHLAGQVEQRLAGVAGRPGDELVVLDHRPRDVRDDVDGDRERHEAHQGPHDRHTEQPARPQPAFGRRAGRVEQADRVAGAGGGQWPEPVPPAQPTSRIPRANRAPARRPPGAESPPSDPTVSVVLSLPAASAPKKTSAPSAAGAPIAKRISSSVQAIGWTTATTTASSVRATMMSRNVRLPSRVAGPRGQHADRHVAEDRRDPDQPEDRQDATERAPDQDQQEQGPDRIGGDPFAREGEAQQDADDRHRDPERRPSLPPARPDRREDRVGGDDEQADVDIVHPDPGLDEEHPVGDDEQADEAGHEAAPEEDPGQEVQAGQRSAPPR